MGWLWSFFDTHIPLILALSSLAVAFLIGIAALIWETIRQIGLQHSFDRTDASDAFFEDPNSLNKVQYPYDFFILHYLFDRTKFFDQEVPCPSIFDHAEKYLSLIIPAYNEEHRLPEALSEIMSYLQNRVKADRSFTYEVLIIDDGSIDKTSKVAFDFVRRYKLDNVRVLLLGRNHGKGEAIRKGILHSRGELLLMLDADGATKVTDLEKLESQIYALSRKINGKSAAEDSNNLRHISDIEVSVFGSRAHLEKQALATRKWYRNFLMKGFHLVVLFAAGPGIRDTQCGFKMFTRAAARKIFMNIRLKRWCFDVEIVYLCKRLNIPIIEISVNWTEIPGSKVRLTSIIHMLFELMLIRLGYGLGIWKIYT